MLMPINRKHFFNFSPPLMAGPIIIDHGQLLRPEVVTILLCRHLIDSQCYPPMKRQTILNPCLTLDSNGVAVGSPTYYTSWSADGIMCFSCCVIAFSQLNLICTVTGFFIVLTQCSKETVVGVFCLFALIKYLSHFKSIHLLFFNFIIFT